MAKTKIKPEDEPFEQVPYPEISFEDLYSGYGIWRGFTSRHTRDLMLLLAGLMAVCSGAFYLIVGRPDQYLTQFLTAIASASVVGLGAIYQLAKRRFSTVDVFSSEIQAKIRIMAADNTVGNILLYSDRQHIDSYARDRSEYVSRTYNAIEPSNENQFEIFYRRSEDLGWLKSEVVDHVTDYYSFHMAARDELRELSATIENFPERSDEIFNQLQDVIYMIDLMACSAFDTLRQLVERRSHQLYAMQIAMCVGTEANAFLLENMKETDRRYFEVKNRNIKYRKIIRLLKREIVHVRIHKTKFRSRRHYF